MESPGPPSQSPPHRRGPPAQPDAKPAGPAVNRLGRYQVTGMDQDIAKLQIWDYAGERRIDVTTIPQGVCRCLAYSPDGSRLASEPPG